METAPRIVLGATNNWRDQRAPSATAEHVAGFTDYDVGPNNPRVRAGAAEASKDAGMMSAALDAIRKDLKRPRRLL